MSNPNGGWIRVHRKIEEWEYYFSEPFDKTHAWLDMLLLANHEKKYLSVRGNMLTVERGEMAWSEESLAKRWRWSRTKVRTFLEWLKTRQQIGQQKSNVLSKIIITNYDDYQKNQTTDQTTERRQKDDRKTQTRMIRTKRIEELKNKEGERGGTFVPPTADEVAAYCRERGNKVDPGRFTDFYASKGWIVGRTRMKDWKAAVRGWESRDATERKGKANADPGTIELHDGSRAAWKWGRWVDADNQSVAIDVNYYPELTKN